MLLKILKKLDISSRYAYYIGLGAVGVSVVVAIRTFLKLWFETNTNFVVSLLVSFALFFIFTQVYSFIILLGLRFLERKEEKL